ncbi:MAG: sigma-70 family RNA polymerase sigma factor [Raineya sp.]|jgi:RNA polymerase sigma-70 factor (ECF subfamily)|nr:sigma-70 family RNA polymerase sigma factor [Raineya sp.]
MDYRQWFQDIIEEHKGIFFKIARTYCLDEIDRQDLTQEMMIQVWQALPKYNQSAKISTWLYRIALNVAISFYRKGSTQKSKNVPLDKQVFHIQEEHVPHKEEQINLLEQFIGELKEFDKALIILYLEDKSHAEIAEILGISVTNVSTKVSRIKEHLKLKFSKHSNF